MVFCICIGHFAAHFPKVRILFFFACKKEGEGGKPENLYGKICIARKRYTKKKSRVFLAGREPRNLLLTMIPVIHTTKEQGITATFSEEQISSGVLTQSRRR